ncbi:MAG TPA: beta-ketoacyl-ACP synthase III [Anaerolineales bacterium]
MSRYAHLTGWGMAVPDRVLTNHELEQMVDTNDEWIMARTGIRERRIADKSDTTASLAAKAALRALQGTDVKAREIDLIIVATSSPEHIFPSTASLVQDRIGATVAGAFDLSAACTGFIFALNMAAQAIRSGSLNRALVIGSETLSRMVNWEDRGTAILFGDGAGAFLLEGRDWPGGVLSCVMRSDGSGGDLLSVPAGGSFMPTSLETLQKKLHLIQMDGREVFRFATRVMASATREVVEQAGMSLEDIDLVIPHQANKRIIEAAARGLKLPLDRFALNIDRYGNTSTASIPIAFCEAFEQGRTRAGDRLVLVGFGGGLTWGALTLQLTEPERVVTPVERRRWWVFAVLARLRSVLRRVGRRLESWIFRAKAKPE